MTDLRTVAYRAIGCHENGQLEDAERLYREYLAAVPDDPPIQHLLGMLRLQRGDPREACRLVQRAADAAPDAVEYRANLGLIFETLGEHEAALDAYQAAAHLQLDDPLLLLRTGKALRRAGQHADAVRLLQQALALDDSRVSAVELAAALEDEGRRGDALDVLEQFHQRHPDDDHVLHIIGALALRHGQRERARSALEQVIELNPGLAAAHNDLGALHLQGHALDDAVGALSKAVAIDPGYADAHYNLGSALDKLTRYDEAVVHYERAIELNPDHDVSYRNLAAVHYKTSRPDRMADVLERHLSRQPDDFRARHMLAAARGEPLSNSDPAYVRELFDNFAKSYDQRLAGIEYRGPALLGLALQQLGNPTLGRVLDAGCGTGLCAPLLRPRAATLVGVDLSPKMLIEARTLGSYDELHEGDLVAFLESVRVPFELIASVDTFVYVGDLVPAFAAAAAALEPGGLLMFTVEVHPDTRTGTFALGPSGRFRHARPYLQASLQAAAFSILLLEDVHLRLELGDPVDGYLVTAKHESGSRSGDRSYQD